MIYRVHSNLLIDIINYLLGIIYVERDGVFYDDIEIDKPNKTISKDDCLYITNYVSEFDKDKVASDYHINLEIPGIKFRIILIDEFICKGSSIKVLTPINIFDSDQEYIILVNRDDFILDFCSTETNRFKTLGFAIKFIFGILLIDMKDDTRLNDYCSELFLRYIIRANGNAIDPDSELFMISDENKFIYLFDTHYHSKIIYAEDLVADMIMNFSTKISRPFSNKLLDEKKFGYFLKYDGIERVSTFVKIMYNHLEELICLK